MDPSGGNSNSDKKDLPLSSVSFVKTLEDNR